MPAWHVHLELQPEELITLHRLGFTGGALAWREGMPEWQPIKVEQGARDSSPPDKEDSLPQPIPLTRRSNSSSGSVTSIDRRRASLFNSGRPSTPPIALAVAHKSERPRPELMLPPPPPIDARPPTELTVVNAARADSQSWLKPDPSRSPISAVREQQPPSIPPLALEARPRTRTVGARALWLGAAALVALSASNGALVSALLWSLRHEAVRPAASAARAVLAAPPANSGAECPAPAASASASVNRALPVSVEQLPLASAASERASAEHAHARSAAPAQSASRSASTRKSAGRAALAEEATPARRAESSASPPTTPGAIDRRALAQAVARAASAASSCGDGPEKGRVALTFSPSGSVQSAQLEQPFGEPGINSCVLRAMGRARVRPFTGEAVTVHKTVSW